MSTISLVDKKRLIDTIKEYAVEHGEFKLKSGRTSSVYIDLRKVTLHADHLSDLANRLLDVMPKDNEFDAVGGPCVGADPLVAAVLLELSEYGNPKDPSGFRGFLVRKEEKDHGKTGLILGPVRPGDRCVLVEDVVTSGASLARACIVARDFGALPVLAVAVLDRGEPGEAEASFKAIGVPFKALLTLKDLGL